MKLADAVRKAASASGPASDFQAAQEKFSAVGVNADEAIARALAVPISVHCWQADDVRGLESGGQAGAAGGLQATGNYPGAARNGDEIRQDFEKAASLIPGALRFNIHAMYAETGGQKVERDELEPRHFAAWIDWCADHGWGLDFNPTCFAHPLAGDNMTLSHPKKSVRDFWIRHCICSREIARHIARKLGSPCVCNIWIPDGRKDSTADRKGPRERLVAALDEVLKQKMARVIDTVESKLFGIGIEDYTVGSHEFYLLYAATRGVGVCFDMGHYHPTESVADKISAAVLYLPWVLLHVSRGIRWDSDHAVLFTDELKAVCDEAVRSRATKKILWATDFFDASINRVAAWVIGVRALRKALLYSMLEPSELAVEAEYAGDGAAKLALQELRSELPFGAVWEELCRRADVPAGLAWLDEVKRYEREVLAHRQ
ncbi:MAG: L-rhamnose isomerase [Armatimonadetes bacterium]|nr:L-rhamnose isomerase [Armatimonadota bacterium]